MRDRHEIRQLHLAGAPIRQISRNIGAARNTVRAALAPGSADTYQRRSRLVAVEPAVRAVLADYPLMSAPHLAVLVDWHGSVRQLSRLARALRPHYLSHPATTHLALHRPATGTVTAQRVQVGMIRTGRLTDGRS